MPQNTTKATEVWNRFNFKRDSGHDDYVNLADKCDDFFFGKQWLQSDMDALRMAGRPAMTINKILPTMLTVAGEQIFNRSEIGFVPRSETATDLTATVLTKLMKQISDNNRLDELRSDLWLDGAISGRGYLDARIAFDDNMQGEVRYALLNPKNVLPDADADEYDPDTWNDVTTTKWLTADDISVLYSEADAKILRARDGSRSEFLAYDSIDYVRNRFGRDSDAWNDSTPESAQRLMRNIRVLDHQYRMLDRQKHFVSPLTGDMRQVPENFDRNKIALFVDRYGLRVIDKLVRRIRWTVVADDIVLFDEWSPYKHFTVIPFFPIFRRGRTAGFVENLLGPQEILNKVSSQELHVINTTANSGYKVKAGALANMTAAELEAKGAKTGIVIEVNGTVDDVEKITPNQVPAGLDRVAYKAEESIKSISGVNDSMQGFDREDVAAKAIDRKKQSGQTGLAKPFANLARTDYIIARNTLDLIQGFYTEERVMTITKDDTTGEQESFVINQQAADKVVNDLTLGEYGVVVTSVPARESLQDSEFDQALALKELGIQVPDTTLIMASRLRNKLALIKAMQGDQTSPEAQRKKQLADRAEEANVSKIEGEAEAKHADAQLKTAKAQEVLQPEAPEQNDGSAMAKVNVDAQVAAADIDQKERKQAFDEQIELQNQRREDDKLVLEAKQHEQERRDNQALQAQQMAMQALQGKAGQNPKPAAKKAAQPAKA